MFVNVLLVVPLHREAFLTDITPVLVRARVNLVVPLQSGLSRKRFVASGTLVPSRDLVEHAEYIVIHRSGFLSSSLFPICLKNGNKLALDFHSRNQTKT